MTEKHVLLVKLSWSYVAGQHDDLCPVFSKKLIQLCPELKSLIKRLNKENRLPVFMMSVHQLVTALPDLVKTEKHLLLLFAEYSDLEISRTYYDCALIAFLMSLEKKLGRNWSPEMRESWIFIFATAHQHLLRQIQLPAVLIRESASQPL
jgi:hypothetical protein